MPNRRPHILLIQADQHRADCLGAAGHPLLQTPHLDRLAGQGVRFLHAFTPIPVCVPARVSLAHGQWPTSHLAIANWGTEAPRPAREGLVSYTALLHEAGYRLAHVGKWHVHPQQGPLAYGFDEDVPASAYAAWRVGRGLPPSPRHPDWSGVLDADISPAETRPAWQADQVIRLLEQGAAEDRPIYLQWDLDEPHLPAVLPEPFYSLYAPQAVAPWPGYPDPLIGKPYAQAQQRRSWGVEDWTWREWAPMVARYLGTISLIDAQVGRVLDALELLGLAGETLVVYTSDHGDLCGAHGMFDKHMVMYDDITRVPLLVRWPGRTPEGATQEAFVSHALDLAVTFCQAAGVEVPETFQGESLLPLLAGTGQGRADILSMYHGNQFGLYSERMLRDARYKLVWNAAAEDELYDLARDPGEIHNLDLDPAYREVRRRLRARLVEWMEAIGDPLLNSWTRRQLLEG